VIAERDWNEEDAVDSGSDSRRMAAPDSRRGPVYANAHGVRPWARRCRRCKGLQNP